jgi:multidrug efflux pump subunit AcrA (membrane-fusion protein)
MTLRKLLAGAAIIALFGGVGVFAYTRASAKSDSGSRDDSARPTEGKAVVRTVKPRLDPGFRISNQQIAVVEPFYQAGLRARAAGVVRAVHKDIGEPVRTGELLVEIDAPDLDADVAQREAVIGQRHKELLVSRALLRYAGAAVETAKAMIAQRTAEAKQAAAIREYKEGYLARVKGLNADKVVPDDVVSEHKRDYLAAEAAAEAAQVAIQKAKADQVEKEASLEAAQADVELKAALVGVAEKDRDRAAAAAAFARVVAPFDGVIVRRNVDPGMFVQNATSGPSEPLITVARTDLVTVVMKLPDVAAPYVSRDTDVEVTFDDLPGLTVHGKVTRFAPAIEGTDRTMRLELDVFNGSRSEFQTFVARTFAEAAAPLGTASGIGSAAAVVAAQANWPMFHKGVSDGVTVCPDFPTAGPGARPLVAGMTATMRVHLDRVAAAYLIPSSAVFSQGGKTYVLAVQDGITRQLPVRVQVNDGRMAKVAILPRPGEGGVAHDLNGNEEIVVSRQLEVGDGARVRTVLADW